MHVYSPPFGKLDAIPGKKRGQGSLVCLAKEILPLTGDTTILPVDECSLLYRGEQNSDYFIARRAKFQLLGNYFG